MALICNGYRLGHMPHKCQGSLTTIYNGMSVRDSALTGRLRNITAGEGITSDRVGIPMGVRHPLAWVMPQKAGELSAHNQARGVAAATLTMVYGRNISGTSAGVATVDGTAKLVVSASASSAGTCTVTGALVAILQLSGTADGSSTATSTASANAWASGTAAGSSTAALGTYALGHLAGHIYVNEGSASVQQLVDGVWGALAASYDESGTMGEKLNGAGTAGDPWTADLTSYLDGTAGAELKKKLNKALFIALK